MKKYLVWFGGCHPATGQVVKAATSWDARREVASRAARNGSKWGGDAANYCARLVSDADEVAPAKPPVQIKRCWVNQPSTHDPLHQYHGRNVLAAYGHEGYEAVLYFTEGPTTSIVTNGLKRALADGWRDAPKHGRLSHADARALRAKIELLVDAEVNYAFKGSLIDAAEKKSVTTEREYARGALENLIKEFTK